MTLYQAECLRRMAQVDLREAPLESRQIHHFSNCFEIANESTLAQIKNHGKELIVSPESSKSPKRKRTPSKERRSTNERLAYGSSYNQGG